MFFFFFCLLLFEVEQILTKMKNVNISMKFQIRDEILNYYNCSKAIFSTM